LTAGFVVYLVLFNIAGHSSNNIIFTVGHVDCDVTWMK